ncbi:DUF2184 domain-containing protein [Desemzia sp. FAM 23990]|uniref:DUF2184 domain-containing protein n=1 Tax=Desemzia sp. FAM 23990 TaxID=3259520 RepID=UPI00388B2DB0
MAGNITATLEARDLEAIDRILYEAPKEELVARSLFNVKSDVDPGAETYGYNVLTRTGVAKIIANGADDLPLVDVDMKREFVQIYTIAAGFRYSVQELRQAKMLNQSVDATKAETVRRAIAEKENSLAFSGDSKYNIKGLSNVTGIQVVNAAAIGTGSSTKWKDKTPAQIEEEIREARSKVTVLPGYVAAGLALALPPEQYEMLDKRYSDFDTRTIKEVIRAHGWFTDIVRVADLKAAGTGKTASMLIIETSRTTAELLIPMDVTRLEEEWKYPNWTIPNEERCGGMIIRAPYGIVRVDGI